MSQIVTFYPSKLTAADIRQSSTLEKSDIGKWAIIVQGTFQIVAGPMPVQINLP